MKIKTKYILAFLSSTALTLIIVAAAWWGLSQLQETTDYLVNHNSRVLENAGLFEKELAISRRAEKEFFIFPDNPSKQAKYVSSWEKEYNTIAKRVDTLQALYQDVGNTEMAKKMQECKTLLQENIELWSTTVQNFMLTKDYDTVNRAEYGVFKEKTHILEDIAKEASTKGQEAVQKGRETLEATQKKIMQMLQILAAVAVVLGIAIPLILAQKMTSTIIELTKISDAVSTGQLDQEINIERKDELGDLARAMKRMQKSFVIMMKRLQKEG